MCVAEVRRILRYRASCDKTTRLVYDMHEKRDELMELERWEGPVNELMDALALKQRGDQAN